MGRKTTEEFIEKQGKRLIIVTRKNTDKTKIKRKKITKHKWEEQLYGHFKQQTSEISLEKTWTWWRKGNINRETESLLIAAQNNAMRTNYIKARVDKMQQNSKCRL